MAGRRRKAFVSLGWISQSRLSGRTGWNGSGLGGSQKAPATPAVTSSAASASQGSRNRRKSTLAESFAETHGRALGLTCRLVIKSAQFWPGMVEEARMDAT